MKKTLHVVLVLIGLIVWAYYDGRKSKEEFPFPDLHIAAPWITVYMAASCLPGEFLRIFAGQSLCVKQSRVAEPWK